VVRSRRLLGICIAGALIIAGCGSSKGGGTAATTAGASSATTAGASTATTAGASAATTAGASAATTAGAAPAAAATGKADASKPPVLVGFHNLEGGAVVSLPEIRQGFESGVNYVNEELGGINGRPLKADECNLDVTPESSVKCANQFVEKKVVAAVQGVDVAADAALPILKEAGIVEIGFFAFSAAMNKAKGDAYFTLFSNEDNYAGDLVTQQKLGAKSEAVLMEDLPTSKALDTDVIQPAAKKLGMTAKPFFYSAQTDWTTFAATIMASSPDAVSIPAAQDQVCLAAIPALRAAGFTGYLHAGSCTEIEKLDVKQLDKVINHNEFFYTSFAKVPAKPQKDLDTYLRFIKRDFPNFKSLLYTQLGFHIAVQAADMLRQVPGSDLSAAAVKKAMPTTKGPSFFRDTSDSYDCAGSKSWPGTSACSSSEVFTKFTAEKKKELLPGQPTDLTAVRPTS